MPKPLRPLRVIVAAASTIWIYHLVSGLSGLVALPLVVAHLGTGKYGIWILVIQSISFLFSTSDLGTGNALGRVVVQARISPDSQALARVFSTALAILMGSLVIVVAAALALAPFVPRLLGVEDLYHSETSLAFIIMAVSLAMQFPLTMGAGILTGHQIYGISGLFKTLGSVISLVGVVGLANAGAIELVPLAVVYGMAPLVGQILMFVVAWRMTGPWSLAVRNVSWATARQIMDFGTSSLVTSFSTVLHRSGIAIAVGRLLGAEAAGIYGIAFTLVYHIGSLIVSVAAPFTTLATEWQGGGETKTARETVNAGMRVIFAMATSAAALMHIYGEAAMGLLFSKGSLGAEELRQAALVLVIMLAGAAVGLPQYISVKTLQGIGRHWQVAKASLAMSVGAVIVGVLSITAGFGLYGAAFGWSAFWVLHGIVVYPLFMRGVLQQSFSRMVYRCYVPGALVGAAILLLSSTVYVWLPPTTVVRLGMGVAFCGCAGLGLVVLMSGKAASILRWASA